MVLREVWLEYLGENDLVIKGWFTILEQTDSYIKFRTHGGNLITINYSRLLRMKERGGAV